LKRLRHIITAVASQRAECFSEHVRLLLTVSLRRMKGLSTDQVKQLWFASQELLRLLVATTCN
jgi:hypothetical protein